jgi:hypothetical protein
MTIYLELKPETEAYLVAQATARGESVEQYLQGLIESNLSSASEQPVPQIGTTGDWVDLLETFCNNPALVNVPPLSDKAISRESIYREREDSQL